MRTELLSSKVSSHKRIRNQYPTRATNPEVLPAPRPEPGISRLNGKYSQATTKRNVNEAHGLNLFSHSSNASGQTAKESQGEAPALLAITPSNPMPELATVKPSDIKPLSEVRTVSYEEPIDMDGWKRAKEVRVTDENQTDRTSTSAATPTTGGWKRL